MKGFCFHTSVSQKLPGEYYHLLQGVTNGWIRTNIDSNSLFPFITKTSRKYFTPKNYFSCKVSSSLKTAITTTLLTECLVT